MYSTLLFVLDVTTVITKSFFAYWNKCEIGIQKFVNVLNISSNDHHDKRFMGYIFCKTIFIHVISLAVQQNTWKSSISIQYISIFINKVLIIHIT